MEQHRWQGSECVRHLLHRRCSGRGHVCPLGSVSEHEGTHCTAAGVGAGQAERWWPAFQRETG